MTSGDHLDHTPTLSLTFTGDDRPGVLTAVSDALAAAGVTRVLDVEQVVVRGRLTLAMLVADPAPADERAHRALIDAVEQAAARADLQVEVHGGHGDNLPRRRGRAHVVVLAAQLSPQALVELSATMAEHGANVDRVRRLSRDPVVSLEFDLSGADIEPLRRGLSLVAARHHVDLAVSPGGLARRGRRLVVLDVDSTLIQDEVIELLARHAGREAEVAAVTEAAMRGELDFSESLHQRVAALTGLPDTIFDEVRREVRLTPGAATLVRTLRRLGMTVALVSGGFAEIVEPLARDLGIDHVQANRLQVQDGRLTGRIDGPVVDRAAKAAALRRFADAEGLGLARTVAIGDGANDLDMLSAAGLGIAFNAKPIVQQQADATVNVPYLDSVLFMLGLSRDDIEEADRLGEVGGTTPGPPVPAPDAPLDSRHA